ncbi:MAG: GDP-mannose 4,6-dehydratase [Caldilineaceae bacterium]
MQVLITGGAGFIGSHLAEALLARGDTVSVLDDLSTGSFDNIRHLTESPGFSFAIESLNNDLVLDRLASQADAIVHLAAAVGVQLVVERPTETIETNVIGAHALLAAATLPMPYIAGQHQRSLRQEHRNPLQRRKRSAVGAIQSQPLGLCCQQTAGRILGAGRVS